MTAKAYGLDEECENILEASGMTEGQIKLPSLGTPLSPPKPIVSTYKANWPTKASSQSFFEKALLAQVEGLPVDEELNAISDRNGQDDTGDVEGKRSNTSLIDENDDEVVAGWDMGDDIVPEVESDLAGVGNSELSAGSREAEMWARNSPLAADHIAGGSFETAMQLLNRQLGAVNFTPLKPRFIEIYQASSTYLPVSSGLKPLVNHVRRTVNETELRKALPVIPRDIEFLAANDLQKGYMAMRTNKLQDGVTIFQGMLHALLVNVVSDAAEVEEAKKLINLASEYSLAIKIELARRGLGTDDEILKSAESLKRNLELAAYFTIPQLEVSHRQLALTSAMKISYTNKNFNSALSFANRILANGGASKLLDNVSELTKQSVELHD